MSITFKKSNKEFVKINIESELLNGVSALPARSETFKIFHIKSEKFPCCVEAQEIDEGLVVPTTIVHVLKTWLEVLKTNENTKIIKTDNIKTSQISDFHILQTQKNDKLISKITRYIEQKSTRIYKRKIN